MGLGYLKELINLSRCLKKGKQETIKKVKKKGGTLIPIKTVIMLPLKVKTPGQ